VVSEQLALQKLAQPVLVGRPAELDVLRAF
jgi:hypothetical protein